MSCKRRMESRSISLWLPRTRLSNKFLHQRLPEPPLARDFNRCDSRHWFCHSHCCLSKIAFEKVLRDFSCRMEKSVWLVIELGASLKELRIHFLILYLILSLGGKAVLRTVNKERMKWLYWVFLCMCLFSLGNFLLFFFLNFISILKFPFYCLSAFYIFL